MTELGTDRMIASHDLGLRGRAAARAVVLLQFAVQWVRIEVLLPTVRP
jgi:hypothetical protein